VDGLVILGAAPMTGKVEAVKYTPAAAINGADTNSRTLTLVNRGPANAGPGGGGNKTAATLALTNGINAAAFTPKAVTVSGVAADVAVTAGDVLVFNSTHIGTGIADPGGTVEVTLFNGSDGTS